MCKIGIYLVCDYPNRENFLEAVDICEASGVDFLEIGFPFSDPVADGPVIEKAALSVLDRENVDDFINSLSIVRSKFSRKLYVMTYANIIFGYGIEAFAKEVDGINGVIVADLPYIESRRFSRTLKRHSINIVHFATPESSLEDLDKLKTASDDFVYFVSIRGITGGSLALDKDIKEKIRYLKKDFDKDVMLGFGIKSRDDIKEACKFTDGVIVGTEAVKNLSEGHFDDYIHNLTIRAF